MKGLAGVARRLSAAPGTIAYLGNSVTAQREGYRPRLHEALVAHFGHPHRAVNAGFGAVGSIASLCTMDDMVVRHRPDLCFIECLTGDMGVGMHAYTGPALEGMVRKLEAIDCAACFLNLPRQDGDFTAANPLIRLYRDFARHHGIPSIDLGSELQGAGAEHFRDIVHTTPEGGRRTALRIVELLRPILATGQDTLPAPGLFPIDFSGAGTTPLAAGAIHGPFTAGRFLLQYPFFALAPGSTVRTLIQDHATIGLLFVTGPQVGAVRINRAVHDLRDAWCSYDRLHAMILAEEIAAGETIEIAPLAPTGDPAGTELKLIGLLTRPA